MSRDWRSDRDFRDPSGRRRRSTAATAPSYDYGFLPSEREALQSRRVRPAPPRTRRRSAANRRFAAFMVALLIWAGLGYASGVVRIVALRRDITRVERELAAARRRNQDLEKTVAEMQTPAYIERAARDQLGLTRPDEVRFVVGRSVDQANPEHRDVARRSSSKQIYAGAAGMGD